MLNLFSVGRRPPDPPPKPPGQVGQEEGRGPASDALPQGGLPGGGGGQGDWGLGGEDPFAASLAPAEGLYVSRKALRRAQLFTRRQAETLQVAPKHAPGQECECCAKPQPMQQTLEELDFDRGLWGAASRGDYAKLAELLGRGTRDVNERDTSGYVALHYASRGGYTDACRLLLDHGARADATTGGCATPLMRACGAGHVEVARLLLARGASAELRDDMGQTCLHKASAGGHDEVVSVLLGVMPGGTRDRDAGGRRPGDLAAHPGIASLLSAAAGLGPEGGSDATESS